MNPEKLAQLQSQARIGGKGTPRRKVYKAPKSDSSSGLPEDKKLQSTLKRLNAQPLSGIDEVNMFRNDGKVIHFDKPSVSASAGANSFVISGASAVKEVDQLFPGILPQLGPENLDILQKLLKDFQEKNPAALSEGVDDDIPDLVQAVDDVDIQKSSEEVD
ncbi:hypothetical protein BB561_004364 [Smittium simulii]|uniref:Nascent polypeptide-associated complex subunit beta n=1 Tax=Smittium simulii TaxID=133385 RepID=A0A2T9YGS6_9FUNG|nr:hypothetical protein BB561_004364 [Smittium simulii]